METSGFHLLFDVEWFRPISVNDLIIGNICCFLCLWCWCLCLFNKASRTLSRLSNAKLLLLIILSNAKSAICSMELASISKITVPFNIRLRNSNRECNESVATCGFDQRFPPSSTSSSNLIHLAVSFHSISSPSVTSSSISENSGWLPCFSSSISSPRINWTRCEGGVPAKLIYIHVFNIPGNVEVNQLLLVQVHFFSLIIFLVINSLGIRENVYFRQNYILNLIIGVVLQENCIMWTRKYLRWINSYNKYLKKNDSLKCLVKKQFKVIL